MYSFLCTFHAASKYGDGNLNPESFSKIVKFVPVGCAFHAGYIVMERVAHQSIIEMYLVIGLDGVQKWIKISFSESRESILEMSINSSRKFKGCGDDFMYYCFVSDSVENICMLIFSFRLRN